MVDSSEEFAEMADEAWKQVGGLVDVHQKLWDRMTVMSTSRSVQELASHYYEVTCNGKEAGLYETYRALLHHSKPEATNALLAAIPSFCLSKMVQEACSKRPIDIARMVLRHVGDKKINDYESLKNLPDAGIVADRLKARLKKARGL